MIIKNIYKLIFSTNVLKLLTGCRILLNIINQTIGYFFGDKNGIIESYYI